MTSIFSCASWPFLCLHGEMSVKILYPSLNWVLCGWVLGVSHMFWILIPYHMHDLKYFAPFVAFLITLLIVFLMHRFIKFSWSSICLFFSFVACNFSVTSKKSLINPMLFSLYYLNSSFRDNGGSHAVVRHSTERSRVFLQW